MKFTADCITGYHNLSVPYSLISNGETSSKLAIIFPGQGYTVQGPLLHYSTGIFLSQSYDVLHVNYQYNHNAYKSFTMEELSEAIKHDCETVIEKTIAAKSYEQYCLIGKSLGTIAMSAEIKRQEFIDAKTIWLTPLLQRDDVFDAMVTSKQKGLCFIGDNDRCYIKDRYSRIKDNPSIASRLFHNANHSLEIEQSVGESINILKTIMKTIEEF
ncbi:alpha/beta hydrolase [Jeotgalibacillus sp. S-D1]|uniref:alpha/beta hydrolase n=1 Tax=Jeotgalibacillus sp. S-D1 TaxID=2552189 RepID=UPI00105A352E|nr:alpha/beta hydrolase [Jeotgalibacillus sp. S-D1]TDL34275.1 alpha/beta hydrolase [Jeotgalibacillus sp. S-D1]